MFLLKVSRLAYELMLTYHPDASMWFHSLDDIFYFGGQEAHEQVAVYPHKVSNPQEISLSVGDIVGIAGNHWDGWSKGRNRKTGNTGLYPSYKATEKWRIVRFPTFPLADNYEFHLSPEQLMPPRGASFAFENEHAWPINKVERKR